MATCSLCPPGSRDIPGHEMDEHRRVVHPDSGEDRSLRMGDSTIVRDVSDEAALDSESEDGEWHH